MPELALLIALVASSGRLGVVVDAFSSLGEWPSTCRAHVISSLREGASSQPAVAARTVLHQPSAKTALRSYYQPYSSDWSFGGNGAAETTDTSCGASSNHATDANASRSPWTGRDLVREARLASAASLAETEARFRSEYETRRADVSGLPAKEEIETSGANSYGQRQQPSAPSLSWANNPDVEEKSVRRPPLLCVGRDLVREARLTDASRLAEKEDCMRAEYESARGTTEKRGEEESPPSATDFLPDEHARSVNLGGPRDLVREARLADEARIAEGARADEEARRMLDGTIESTQWKPFS